MARRFIKFNSVGIVGFAVQLGVLALLLHFGVHYLAATALAVEASVLHNFVWHQRWTWRDRPATGGSRLARLWRFHALNGLVSLVGNVLLMRLLVGTFGLPAVPANLLAVVACSLVNYFASDRVVFEARASIASEPAERSERRSGERRCRGVRGAKPLG